MGTSISDQIDELMPSGEDLLYEEELLRNPYSLKWWWRYIQAKTNAAARKRYLLYERAVKALPGSYKVSRGVGWAVVGLSCFTGCWAAFGGLQIDCGLCPMGRGGEVLTGLSPSPSWDSYGTHT